MKASPPVVCRLCRAEGLELRSGNKGFRAFSLDPALLEVTPEVGEGKDNLLLTSARRARALGFRLKNGEGEGAVVLDQPEDNPEVFVNWLSDPLAEPSAVYGSLEARPSGEPLFDLLVELAKREGLLPLLALVPHCTEVEALTIQNISELLAGESERLDIWASAPLSLPEGRGIVHVFKDRFWPQEHLALALEGEEKHRDKAPLVRIHSQCHTGDLFGSLRCDCGAQLAASLERIGEEGGVLLYLAQEGRGIGLVNKIRAYNLQDGGLDTLEANHQLGFEADERRYGLAALMLEKLGIRELRLLTNNPQKLGSLGPPLKVLERVALAVGENLANRSYLSTKKNRFGHLM